MREKKKNQPKVILAHGKCIHTQEWTEGYFVGTHNGKSYICQPNIGIVEIYPDSVGDYIGIDDRNGKHIFDGDVVRHYNHATNKEYFEIGIIRWNQQDACFERTSSPVAVRVSTKCEYEVVGNIFDNTIQDIVK